MIKNKRRNSSVIRKKPINSTNQKKPGILSTLGESMMWGAGMGMGSEAGHSIFRGIFGNNKEYQNQETNVSNSTCSDITKLYEKCILSNSFEQDKCEFLKEDIRKFCTL